MSRGVPAEATYVILQRLIEVYDPEGKPMHVWQDVAVCDNGREAHGLARRLAQAHWECHGDDGPPLIFRTARKLRGPFSVRITFKPKVVVDHAFRP